MTAKEPLSATHPELAKQAHGWDPSLVTAGSSKKLLWKCATNHVWLCEVRSRAGYKNSEKSCTVCSSLEFQFPEIAKQAYGWDPSKYSIGTSKTLPWKCEKGHIWETRIIHRTTSGTGCPFCWGRFPIVGETDLAFTHPEIAALAHGWDPTKVSAGSEKKMEWCCALGHIWTAQVFALLHGNRCPYCANNKVLIGYNDLLTTHPDLASETTIENSQSVTAGSNKLLDWRCALGHEYKASAHTRASSRATGCPVCAGKQVVIGINDLNSTHPTLATEAYEWDPKSLTSGSNKKVRWKCHLHHVWSAKVNSRALAGNGCPTCANQVLLKGFNDLRSTHPEIAEEANGWDASTFISSKGRKFSWKCSQGHQWMAEIDSRKAGRNCPTCARFGFDPNSDGFLYFLEHPDWEMFQIGITNIPEDRLGSHKRLGWEVIELRGPMDGHLTQQWETAMLRMLKAKGADLSNFKVAGKFDGYSEAWSKSTFEVSSIKEIMRLTEEFEDGISKEGKNEVSR